MAVGEEPPDETEDRQSPGLSADTQLVLAAQAGDRAAFGALVERHGDALYRWLWHLTRRHDLAEDLAQEALMRAFTRLGLFEAGTNFRAWLFRIGHNAYANWCRSRARRKEETLRPGVEGKLPGGGKRNPRAEDPSAALEDGDTRNHLLGLLEGMPVDYHQALTLRVEGELSFREIGELCGVTEETARWRVYKGRRWLEERARLGAETIPGVK